MRSWALPQEFGVGAADVISVQRQGVGEQVMVLAGKAIAELANARGEWRGNLLQGFLQGKSGGSKGRLGKASGIGGNPIDSVRWGQLDGPLDEFVRGDYHFGVQGLE